MPLNNSSRVVLVILLPLTSVKGRIKLAEQLADNEIILIDS